MSTPAKAHYVTNPYKMETIKVILYMYIFFLFYLIYTDGYPAKPENVL